MKPSLFLIFLLALLLSGYNSPVWASEVAWDSFSNEQIVNAIFYAEGGYKAEYLYGIRSIPYKDIAEARQICLNTVRNNRKRFAQQTKYTDFIEFLGSRYCPIGADNDNGTNRFWERNVKYWLAKGEGR